MKNVVVIIGYNRVNNIKRCFESVKNAFYEENDQLDIIFSLDYHEKQKDIINMINSFEWQKGKLIIKSYNERQGLRKHIITCGSYIENYDALIMLEDDIEVSNSYYSYVKQALIKYGNLEKIAGISLYKHESNFATGRYFIPQQNDSDVFFIQCAQSWGQCWNKRMWYEFKEWYDKNENFKINFRMPRCAYSWDERSWLRYYMGFITETNKYLVYPYCSLSTNVNTAGENNKIDRADFQVPMYCDKKTFKMIDFEDGIKYDAFLEREYDNYFSFKINEHKCLLDLYGERTNYGDYKYLASCRRLNYHILKTYGMIYRPQEINLLKEPVGEEIFLYDLSKKEANNMKDNNGKISLYEFRAISWKRLIYAGFLKVQRKYKNKFKI